MTFLNDSEKKTLALLCDTLIPSLEPLPGDDPALFGISASDLDIPNLLEEALERVTDTKQQKEIAQFLRLVENGAFNGVVSGQWSPVSEMPLSAREKLLYRLAIHPIERMRVAFLSIKRLTMFVFYSVMPDAEANPTWPAIGYNIPGKPEPTKRPIEPVTLQGGETLTTEVLIIGSGAGGGVVAGELAAAGHEVMIVEKGEYFHDSDFDGAEIFSMEHMYEKFGALVTEDTSINVLAGSVLGGGTTVNWTTSLRPPEHVLQEWANELGFTAAIGDDYRASFDAVSKHINVTTEHSQVDSTDAKLEQGLQALGHGCEVIPRNVKGCEDCGYCNFGCPFGAKQSTLKTYLQDAYDAGARIGVKAHVDRVLHQNGKVTGAMLTVEDENGISHSVTVKAKVVILSAGTIHTPAIMIRSGLRNPNIGANLHLHPTTVISGVFDNDMSPWHGRMQTRTTFDFNNLDGKGYGIWLETAPAHPGINGLANAWLSGAHHKRVVQKMRHTGNIIILVRDRDSGRVKLDVKGQPILDYRISKYDANHLLFGLIQAVRVYDAVGAREIATSQHTRPTYTPGDPGGLEGFIQKITKRGIRPNDIALFSAHQMSTARIGGNPKIGAIDPTGQSYEVKNLFVADGSALPNAPGVNPMLPIMGTAHYIAQQIKAVL